MSRWSPDFPGRLVDFPDYCHMYEVATFRKPGTVFAYEPMWNGPSGEIYPSNTLVIAAWLEAPGHGPFEVLENAARSPSTGQIFGLRNFAQLRTGVNAADVMAEHVAQAHRDKESRRISQKRDARAARKDLGNYVLKRAPGSQVGRRMVRESN